MKQRPAPAVTLSAALLLIFGTVLLAADLLVIFAHLPTHVLTIGFIPVLVAALFYDRWVYLTLLAVASAGLWIGELLAPGASPGWMISAPFLIPIVLVAAEISYSLRHTRRKIEAELRQQRADTTSLLDHLPVGVYRLALEDSGAAMRGAAMRGAALRGANQRIVHANQALAHMLGFTDVAALLEAGRIEALTSGTLEGEGLAEALRQPGAILSQEKELSLPNGQIIVLRDTRWVNHSLPPGRGVAELSRVFIDGVLEDITERKAGEKALQESRIALQQANEKLTTWVRELARRNEQIELLNRMGELLQSCHTMSEAHIVIGQSLADLFPSQAGGLYIFNNSRNLLEIGAQWGCEADSVVQVLGEDMFAPDDCWALRLGREHVVTSAEYRLRCAHVLTSSDGTQSSFPYLCIPLAAQGETLGLLHMQLQPSVACGSPSSLRTARTAEPVEQLAATVSERVALALANLRLRENLSNQAVRDPLTGLFNRRYMIETLERELRRAIRHKRPLGTVMLDIDHFKKFNDTFGYAAGDALLQELGRFLLTHLRGSDVCCRYGGEEFILILPESSLEATCARAEQLREEVKHLFVEYRGQPLRAITISLGVAAFPEHGSSSEEILRAVDTPLRHAKRQGRDRVLIASSN